MVEVFITNVGSELDAKILCGLLTRQFPAHKINFDLDDCDRVLRIEGDVVDSESIIDLICRNDYRCCVME